MEGLCIFRTKDESNPREIILLRILHQQSYQNRLHTSLNRVRLMSHVMDSQNPCL